MEEYKKTINYLFTKVQESDTANEAYEWSQALLNIVHIELQLLKKIND